MGTNTTNNFIYLPAMGAEGNAEKTLFDAGMQNVDTKLGAMRTIGDPGYATLPQALATIGSTPTVLYHPPGRVQTITTTIITWPSNVYLTAGPYQLWNITTGSLDLSSCPNGEYPIEWMCGTSPTDIASTLDMYSIAFGYSFKLIKLGFNGYPLITPVVVNTTGLGLNIIGQNDIDSSIEVNVGAGNIGISIGSDSVYVPRLTMKGFSFTGPSNACKHALLLSQVGNADVDINCTVGSTDFAIWVENCDWLNARIYGNKGQVSPVHGTYSYPAKVLQLSNGGAVGGENASKLYFNSETQGCNPALSISAYHAGGGGPCGGLEVSGGIENWTGSPIVIDGIGNRAASLSESLYLTFKNMYIESSKDNVGGTIPVSNAALVDLSGLIVNDSKCQVQLSYTKHVTADPPAYFAGGLTIAPDCQATNIGPVVAETLFEDYAGDTIYSGGPSSAGSNANHQPFGAGSQDPTNYMYNVQLTRWKTSIMDGGWGAAGSVTYTKETGTVHILPTSAKMVNASGADAFTTLNLDAYQLQQFKGRYVTFSANFFLKSTDVYSDNPYLQIYFSCAARVNSTVYNLGEGITVGGATYVCVAVTGDSKSAGSAPVFDSGDGHTTVDGHITWRAGQVAVSNNPIYNQITMTPGKWYPYMVGAFCPRNATSGACVIAQRPQTGGGNGTMYLAEPSLMIGRQAPRSYVPNNPNEVLVGSVRLWGTTPATGQWVALNDWDFSTRKYCSTAGVEGSGAVWT